MRRNARLSFEQMETMVEQVNSQRDASLAGERLKIHQLRMFMRLKLLQGRNGVGWASVGCRFQFITLFLYSAIHSSEAQLAAFANGRAHNTFAERP